MEVQVDTNSLNTDIRTEIRTEGPSGAGNIKPGRGASDQQSPITAFYKRLSKVYES